MIIEFNGLPGTGKTTIATHLKKMLDEAGIHNEFYGRIPCYSKKENFNLALKYGKKFSFEFFKFVLCRDWNVTKNRIKIAISVIAYYNFYFRCNKEKTPQVLLIDQGIIQGLISVAHTDEIKKKKRIDKIIKTIKNLDIRYISSIANAEISKERLVHRENGGSRFDKMNEIEREKNLYAQQKNFEIIRSSINEVIDSKYLIEIDTSIEPQQNAKIIFDTIIKGLKNLDEENS